MTMVRKHIFGGVAAAALVGATLITSLATAATDTGAPARAAEQARDAEKALGKHKPDKAVAAAEAAVALAPHEASYRTLLGQAYLMAGRFVSAGEALKDALTLDPADGAAALHLALAQIATGDWATARNTLSTHQANISAADGGLALALAGDPASAVGVLTNAARTPGADVKTRQNLALALALAGRWADAKTVAALDMSPDKVDKRIMEWAAFAQPRSASDQVASLLGVTPIEDGGQPQRLALNLTSQAMAAVAQVINPVDAFMPGPAAPAQVTEAPATDVVAPQEFEPAPAVVAAVAAPAVGGVVFAPRQEIVQALPVAVARAVPVKANPVKAAPAAQAVARRAAAFAPASGDYYVQLGAYENAAVARDSWTRMARGNASLAAMTPGGVAAQVGGVEYYRLSVGGFTRHDAVRLCSTVRARGGRCFVRVSTGDTVASWVKRSGGVQLASR
jgi:Flp pilus assembly protein TadD